MFNTIQTWIRFAANGNNRQGCNLAVDVALTVFLEQAPHRPEHLDLALGEPLTLCTRLAQNKNLTDASVNF